MQDNGGAMTELYGIDLFGDTVVPETRGLIADKFIVPPFSVLNAREGFWQDRKRAWLAQGIRSEVGRDGGLTFSGAAASFDTYRAKNNANLKNEKQDTSIFDPVLCELMYIWFSAEGMQVVDPFAGGSVRGIVAALLNRKYWGCDLSGEQIAANKVQGAEIVPDNMPQWIQGDAADEVACAPDADFILSCPPYGDLEVYSNDPSDLSAMDKHAFIAAYRLIIARTCARLRDNRFACFVVGDYRDKRGNYANFVSETIHAFKLAGLHLYNEAILITSVGSLPVRIGRQFEAGRKLGKTHQNVLVFVKGDGRKAADACKSGL